MILILVSVPLGVWRAMADTEPPYKIKILEIVDNGSFVLRDALAGTDNVTVDTMRMKTFVAMREELNGKYDAVYFGEGTYSTAQPSTFTSGPNNEQRKAHNTTDKLNDITKLKADQIAQDYIQLGLPVIFHASVAKQSADGKLYALYNAYKTRSNVRTVNDAAALNAIVKEIKSGNASYKQRPQIELLTKPEDFLANPTRVYTTGDTLNFTFNANNVRDFSSPVNAKLYISVDKVLKLTDENIVSSSTLTARSGKLSYKLPQTFSGPIYWRLEVTANNLTDYTSGAFRVHDKQTVIRVLQVMPSNNASSLTTDTNMTPSYLRSADYDIQITPVLFSEFNNASNANSYANLNGKYDMVIFGFVDNYNSQTSSALSDAAAAGVNAFINTGQAVMFTHDTMIGDKYNAWIKSFQKATGQTGLYTNLGLGAPNPSTRTKIVNSGMLTQFPFDLSVKPSNKDGYVGQIKLTHNQYYALDLEDPTVVPWYNIVSETGDDASYKRDSDDSYDHYYTYSKGNVTYSGTGHTNTRFPEWEQKLFVNTMFRAFIGSNHAPTIEVIAPTESERTKPSYLKDLVFSYQVNDLDLQDPTVYSSVRFKVNGQYVKDMAIPEENVPKGAVITKKFANPLPLKEGTIQIEITARDKQGASVVKTIDLTMKNVKANLLPDRTTDVPSNFEVLTRSTVGMKYTVTPQNIPAADIRPGESGLQKLEISNVAYTEKLQAGLEIAGDLPIGMTKTGTAATGYTLTKKFDKITYTLNGSSYVPDKGSQIAFSVNVIPTVANKYNLNEARLSYEDVHASDSSGSGQQAIDLLKGYSLITLGESKTTIGGGELSGRALFGGAVSLSNFSMGGGLPSKDPSFPTVATRGDLDITGGSIYNGPILSGGSFTSSQFGFDNTTVVANGSVNMTGNNGLNNTSIWAGGNLNLVNYQVGNGMNFYTPGNFSLTGSQYQYGVNGGSILYGGTSNFDSPYVKSSSPDSIRSSLAAQKSTTNAKGVSDFAAVKQQLLDLSNAYNALTVNGTRDTADTSGIVFRSKESSTQDPAVNVFKVDGRQLSDLKNIKIYSPAGSTVILNVVGGNVTFSGGFDLLGGITADRVIVNYVGTGSVTLTSVGLKATLLAPTGTVDFKGGDVFGTIVAGAYTTTGWTSIGKGTFAGAAPGAAPTPGETQNIPFPPAYFNAVVKTKSIAMSDQALWINDSTTIVPTVELSDGTVASDPRPLLTWSTKDPFVKITYPENTKDGKSEKIIVEGVSEGVAVITATATDGSGKTGTVKINVESPALSIQGSPSVNVRETKQDIRTVLNNASLTIKDVQWEVIEENSGRVKITKQTDPSQLHVEGIKSGTVTLRATATVVSASNAKPKVLYATHQLTITDKLDSVQILGPDAVKKNGTIELNTVIEPGKANIDRIVWSITDGSDKARLNPVITADSPQPVKAKVDGLAPGPVQVTVTVRTAGDKPSEITQTKTIWVLDMDMQGPDTVFMGESINFETNILPAGYPGAKEIKWSVKDVENSGSGIGPYAALETPTNNGQNVQLNGNKPGIVEITATISTPAGDMTVTRTVNVKPVVTALLLPPTVPVQKGGSVDLINNGPQSLLVEPFSIKASDIMGQLEWSSAEPDKVSVSPKGVITGKQEGSEIVVTVSYKRTPDSAPITASTRVIVAKPADPNAPADGDRY